MERDVPRPEPHERPAEPPTPGGRPAHGPRPGDPAAGPERLERPTFLSQSLSGNRDGLPSSSDHAPLAPHQAGSGPLRTEESQSAPASNGQPAEIPPEPLPPEARRRKIRRVALLLFVTTGLSTFLVGMAPGGGLVGAYLFVEGLIVGRPPGYFVELLLNGLAYAGALMLILLAHEMGHYLQARRYGVPATLPFFIPFPITPFGTMGAVIVQGAGVADRRALFDIAVSGPLAGLVFVLPVAWLGVQNSVVREFDPNGAALIYQDPLVLKWMITAVHGPLPPGSDVQLNPLYFAGWVGIFITALNLIPIGQLDGGHILYTLIGRRAHAVAYLLLALAVGYMIYSSYPAYGLMVLLLFLMGPRHPPTADDRVPLGATRIIIGWLTLAFIVIGFTPRPIL